MVGVSVSSEACFPKSSAISICRLLSLLLLLWLFLVGSFSSPDREDFQSDPRSKGFMCFTNDAVFPNV